MPEIAHPLDVEASLVCHIGMLAIQWSRVEFTLKKIAVALVGAEAPAGLLLVGDMGFRALDNFIACVIASKPPKKDRLMDDLGSLMGEAQRLYALRNTFIHNTWTGEQEKDKHHLLVLRFRGKIQFYSEVWPDETMTDIIEDIVSLLCALTELARKHKLFNPFYKWEKRATSTGTRAQPRAANPRGRSPKTAEVLTRLGALPR